ncbi:DALR anticodon-binding domain-containing protein 3 [Nephila pilipes]|uniref:DALR anticodon-binding domain-containing protein 3 n=1 Tax=Nephila pilipes TaxID=299642 RepID=A0A8X6P260_NEPPI|nr:DALR anticodon-binding domain-containing protein 3 [Nephila pilipes]
MSLLENLQSLSLSDNKSYSYFFIKFQNDVQVIFDEISAIKNVAHVSVNIVKGSIYLKGDYFIPLKSNDMLLLNCKELLEKLKNVSSVLSVEVDSNYNLLFCFQRTIVYEAVLQQVMEHSTDYGMLQKNKSVLVLIDTDKVESFDSVRNVLLAEHIISLLTANKVKVFSNEYSFDTGRVYPQSTKLLCSDNCPSLLDVCEELKNKAMVCNWKIDPDENDYTCLDSKKYIEINNLKQKYGNVLNTITLFKDNMYENLHRTGVIKHLLKDHMPVMPDIILHISSQRHDRQVYKSEILLGMLEELKISHSYIFNQSTFQKDANNSSMNEFIQAYRTEVEAAMNHKYSSFTTSDEKWIARIESLVDTAVKFDFLKISHSNIINLRSPNSCNGGKNFGIFVQYNFARLSNLFRNFETKVKEGYYNPLLSLKEVDFSLLKLEEEWNLFHFVLSFPNLVQNVLDCLLSHESGKIRYRLNKICLMLQKLCQNLSLYYSKIRILSGPQAHLQKTMNARLWLLKGIHQVFTNSFILLNVNGLDLM